MRTLAIVLGLAFAVIAIVYSSSFSTKCKAADDKGR